ncbi:hypothetical protein PoB_002006300 [Plakobranchus ocellatus]|uniref:Uncharacterized protein n=1 Tax=Plakobranchus ocellatus TaxID=259542 RepID=A0AAV3ZFL2_9GAST|nr:hypothetical protein PoB_002006300 [Plakobranchus ocellatus]
MGDNKRHSGPLTLLQNRQLLALESNDAETSKDHVINQARGRKNNNILRDALDPRRPEIILLSVSGSGTRKGHQNGGGRTEDGVLGLVERKEVRDPAKGVERLEPTAFLRPADVVAGFIDKAHTKTGYDFNVFLY